MEFREIEYKSPEWRVAVKLREDVLRKPLGSVFSKAELEEEVEHLQVAGFDHGQLVATAVLVPEGDRMKMQRVAVLPELRNANIGSQMIEFCEALGKRRHVKEMYCHARDSAVNFYLKNHYAEEGDYFDEDGIPHVLMTKTL